MIGREFAADMVGKYRFGMNTQEKDDEIYGRGNTSSAEFWEYDTRLGRKWNIDIDVKVWESSYACFANNPIWFSDPNGKDTLLMHRGGGKEQGTSLGVTALIYPITFSIIENGIETTINTGHTFYMVSNADRDRYVESANKDNELTKQPYYPLSIGPLMTNHDGRGPYGEFETVYLEVIKVGNDGVFLHQWQNVSWFGGCKGLTTNLQINSKGPVTTLAESIEANNIVKGLYNYHLSKLTGAKFLLKTNSNAAPQFTTIPEMQSKSVGSFQSAISTQSPQVSQIGISNTCARKMSKIERATTKIKIAMLKAIGN